jgi:hypothetical protein
MYIERPNNTGVKQLSPAEKRSLQRRHLLYYLRMWDASHNKLLGHLADVSLEGFLLVGEEKIEIDREISFEMKLPANYGEEGDAEIKTESLFFKAISCWSSNDVNELFFDTGFKYTEISDETRERIQNIIEDWGF